MGRRNYSDALERHETSNIARRLNVRLNDCPNAYQTNGINRQRICCW